MKWNEGYSEISCGHDRDWDVGLLRQLVVGKVEKTITEWEKSEGDSG